MASGLIPPHARATSMPKVVTKTGATQLVRRRVVGYRVIQTPKVLAAGAGGREGAGRESSSSNIKDWPV